MCHIVKSQALNKEYFYCRKHKIESSNLVSCQEQPKAIDKINEFKVGDRFEVLKDIGYGKVHSIWSIIKEMPITVALTDGCDITIEFKTALKKPYWNKL